MKDIKKHYQDLIKDINLANDKIVSGLKNHITWLESKVLTLQEEIEKSKESNQLQSEIDEYNRLEAQNNMNLEDDLATAKSKINELVADINSARAAANEWEDRFYTLVKAYGIDLDKPVKTSAVVHHCGEGEPKVLKPKTRRRSKTVVAHCKDCGTYFQAKSKNAKYCSACGQKRAKASRAKWLAKQK